MSRLIKIIQLPLAEQYFLLKAFLLTGSIRLGLWVLPYRVLSEKIVGSQPDLSGIGIPNPGRIMKISHSVKAVSRCIPSATCLTQALAAFVLLKRERQPAQFYIGVMVAEQGEFKAHAWVKCDGKYVVGKIPNVSGYTALTTATKSNI